MEITKDAMTVEVGRRGKELLRTFGVSITNGD